MLVQWVQRGVIGLAVLIGGLVSARLAVTANAGSLFDTFIPLTTARPIVGGLALIVAVIAATLLAAGCRVMNMERAAWFVLSAALLGGAIMGGPIHAFLAAVHGPAIYLDLALETVLLFGLLLAGWLALQRIAPGRPADLIPASATGTEGSGDPADGKALRSRVVTVLALAVLGTGLVGVLLGGGAARGLAWAMGLGLIALGPAVGLVEWLGARWAADPDASPSRLPGQPPRWASAWVRSGAVLVVGAVISVVLLRSVESGQVIGGLLLAFGGGTAAGDAICPGRSRLALLAAPLALGFGAYVSVGLDPPSGVTLWAAFMTPGTGGFPVLAAVPPIFYASAGVAGVAVGLAIRASVHAQQAVERQREAAAAEAGGDAASAPA